MKNYIIFLCITLLVGSLISWLIAGKLVSPALSEVKIPASRLPINTFIITSNSGTELAGWHIDANNNNGVIVLFHALRANKESMLNRAKLLYENGYSVVLIDFQAHGESSGKNISMGFLEKHDVLATIEYAKKNHHGQPIALIGVSLGGAAILLASPNNVDAIILESVYTEIGVAVVNRVKNRLGFLYKIPAEILLLQLQPRLGIKRAELAPINHISRLDSPIFIISGSDDTYTTQEETLQLFSYAKQPKQLWLVKGAIHEDLYVKRPVLYKNNILAFLSAHMKN